MRKKSLVGIALAGVMAIGMCMPVMAEGVTTATSKELTVNYEVAPSFTVQIPSEAVTYSGTETILPEITATADLFEDGKLLVTVDKDTIEMATPGNRTATIPLKVKGTGEAAAIEGFKVAEFDDAGASTNAAALGKVVLGAVAGAKAGDYTGTLTFTIAAK